MIRTGRARVTVVGMKRVAWLLLALAAAPLGAAAMAIETTAITHVAVVGPAGIEPDLSILVVGDRIERVGPATVAPPAGARVVDGRGAFVIAGLWDMHVHLASYPAGLPLFVAYGVTGARDMGSASAAETQEMLAWRKEIAAGARVGPRLVLAGPTLDGRRAYRSDGRVYATTADEGRAAVATVRERGGDFVKVHDWVGSEAYAAIVAAARAGGLDVVGHTPAAIPAREAVAAGQRSIEHLGSSLGGFLLDASSREPELRRELLQRMDEARAAGSEASFWEWVVGPVHQQALLDAWDPARAGELVSLLRERGTWHCPTLTVLSPAARSRSEKERRILYASAHGACGKLAPAAKSTTAAALFARQLAIVGDLERGGVGLLAGTDTMPPSAEAVEEFGTCDVPLAGLSVHEELEWLVAAGLTPSEALAAASSGPAKFFGEEGAGGSIAVGKRADLVLLEGNPLDDIRNTRRIRAVVAAGRLYDRAALDALLQQGATDAAAR